MSNAANYPMQAAPARGNGLGMAGFIVSLAGLVITGGILCPIGLLLSLIGLRRPPRGFAVAGAIIGGIGSLVGLVVGLVIVGLVVGVSVATREVKTMKALDDAHVLVRSYADAHGGDLPDDADGQAIVESQLDAWGHPLRYERLGPRHMIISAGRDGNFDTADDRRASYGPGQ